MSKAGSTTAEATGRKTLYLIDGHAQIFRAYHAIRSLSSPVTKEPTNATFGFVGMLLKLFRDLDPDYVVMTIDASGDRGTFRSQIDPQYKANRDQPPEDLAQQVARIVQICELWGIPVLAAEGVEADDTIATVCEKLGDRTELCIRIVSRDKDLQQLLGPRVQMYDIHRDETFDVATLREQKGIGPEQVVDMLSLMGDTADNIPGAKGVGPKTAAKLIAQYGNLDELLAHATELSGKLRQNIEAAADRLPMNRQLVELRKDVPIDFDLSAAAAEPPALERLLPVFEELGFGRHVRDLKALAKGPEGDPPPRSAPPEPRGPVGGLFDQAEPEEGAVAAPQAEKGHFRLVATAEELDEVIQMARQGGGVLAVDTETDRLDPMQAQLCGVSLSWRPHEGVYVPLRSVTPADHLDPATVTAQLRPLLEDPAILKVGQNLKYDMIVLRRAGIDLAGEMFDTMVAAYLIDATRPSYKLDNLALAYLGYRMIPITDLLGSGRTQRSMIDLPASTVTDYAAEDAEVTLRLRQLFLPMLADMDLSDLLADLEMPLVPVLAEMEYNGIRVEPEELDRQKGAIQARISELHDQVMEVAGTSFNPDSPKQLGEVLFKQLGCKVIKRGKTGPSTNSEVLQRIAEEQPPPGSVVAALILEYRQLTKLRGTYLQSLKAAIHPDTGRIHASFNQTVTATGRLSSSDPNLQNIPIRTELGRQIRRAFVAEPGHVLLGADYSQIELRLLAHLSGDEGLKEAFAADRDIHQAVAAQIFQVPLEDVTAEQRGTAKMVNFGIVYGVTPYGLARRLPATTAGSSVEVARTIIADYKARYPKIDAFLADCVNKGQVDGYVQTVCRRRRLVPEVNSTNANTAAFGQRIAINTVVQGSAADLIKVAMVRMHDRIRLEQRPLKMLLQIHDELVFEVPRDAAAAEAEVVREEMVGAMELSVPLKVDIASGSSWFDCK